MRARGKLPGSDATVESDKQSSPCGAYSKSQDFQKFQRMGSRLHKSDREELKDSGLGHSGGHKPG